MRRRARSGARGATTRATRSLAAIDDTHARVRRAVAAGLGEFRGDERAARALADRLQRGDPSVFVEAEAALALGRTRSPLALELLPTLFGRPSFQDVIAHAAPSRGWARPATSARFPLIRRAWRPDGACSSRGARSSSRWPSSARDVVSRARRASSSRSCFADPDFRVRGEAAAALARLGLVEALPAIERRSPPSSTAGRRRRMTEAIRDIEDGARPAEEAQRLQDEVDRLRGETARLRERLDKLETRLAPPPAPSPPPAKIKRPRPVTRRRTRGLRPVRR